MNNVAVRPDLYTDSSSSHTNPLLKCKAGRREDAKFFILKPQGLETPNSLFLKQGIDKEEPIWPFEMFLIQSILHINFICLAVHFNKGLYCQIIGKKSSVGMTFCEMEIGSA